MPTKIKVVSRFYNEEFLVPFFLRHYDFADEIVALVTPGSDRTLELLAASPKVRLEVFESPQGLDDIDLTARCNAVLAKPQDADWLIVPDADEFIWPADQMDVDHPLTGSRVRSFLNCVKPDKNFLVARMYQVYRHVSESDLDPSKMPAPQRRHGLEDRNSKTFWGYNKPIIFRANRGLTLGCGQHSIKGDSRPSSLSFDGAHWAMADLSFALSRCCRDRRDRMSERNKQEHLGHGRWTIQEDSIRAICKEMENAPKLF